MKLRLMNLSLLLVGILGISLLIMVTTPLGLPTAVRILSSVVPGELSVSGYSGRLIDNIHADTITYQNDRVNVVLSDVTVKWDAIRLLTKTLYIEHLEAKNIIVESLSTTEEDAGFPLDLSQFSSDSLNVIIDQFNLHMNNMDFTGTLALNEHGLRIRKANIIHPEVNIQLQANIGPSFNPPIKIIAKESFTLEGVTPIRAETRLIGNLDKLEGSHIFTEGLNATMHVIAQHIGPYFTLAASGNADIPDLNSYSPHLTGELHVDLQLQYEHTQGKGKVSLKSAKSKINGKAFQMNFDGTIQDYIVNWKNNKFIFGEDRLITSGSYGPDILTINWDLITTQLETALQSRGSVKRIDSDTVLTTLQSLSLTFPDKTLYALKQPANIQINTQEIRLQSKLCLMGPNQSSFCAQNSAANTILFQLNNIPHQLIARYFTPRFTITGNINAQALLTLNGLQFHQLEAKTDISPMEVIRGKRKPRTLFKTGAGWVHFHIDNQLLTSTGHLGFIESDHLDWTLQVNDWHNTTLATLASEFKGSITHWDPLRLWITDTNDFSGKVSLDIQANGPVLNPTYAGSLTLNETRLAIPGHGLILQDGFLQVTPSATHHQLNIDGNIRSGDGTLKLGGKLLLEDRWPSLDLKIQGERFTLSNTNAAVVYASPNLHIVTHEKQMDITGDIQIPEAKLNIKGYHSYISPSPDIVLVDDNPPASSLIYDVNSHVSLSLGKDIKLKASHLDTEVRGRIEIVKIGDAPVRATGQLFSVNGKYAAYGKKLDLSKAVLSFNNSPIDNPNLFIEASRNVQISQLNSSQYLFTDPTPQSINANYDGIVGLRITGNVQNPKYTFFSTPPMNEADQLSYLLTGAPSSQVGAAQAAFMFAALTETSGMLGVSDTDAARLQNITRTIGIDFNIESGSHINTATGERINDTNLVVGKAIRPRLYVSYTVGLLDPMNVFRVRYQLSRHWAAQSQANSQGDTGGDILYGIESDAFLGYD